MLKAPRFMREYASYMIKEIDKNEAFDSAYKAERITGINEALEMYSHGLCSVWETMSMIGTGQYMSY